MSKYKMAILLRRAKLSDAKGLAKLYLQFWEPHQGCDPLIVLQNKLTLKSQITFAKKDLKRKGIHIFVATENEKIAGFIEILIKKNDAFFKIKRYGYINSCVTDKKERGRGIARKLTLYAFKFLKSKGIRCVKLNVYGINQTAVAVWQKLGFKVQSINMFKAV